MAEPGPAKGICFGVRSSGEVIAASWYGDPPSWDTEASARSYCSYGGLRCVSIPASRRQEIDAFFEAMRSHDESGAGA